MPVDAEIEVKTNLISQIRYRVDTNNVNLVLLNTIGWIAGGLSLHGLSILACEKNQKEVDQGNTYVL